MLTKQLNVSTYEKGLNEDSVQGKTENPQIHCVCLHRYSLHFLVQSGLSYSVMVFSGLENMHK